MSILPLQNSEVTIEIKEANPYIILGGNLRACKFSGDTSKQKLIVIQLKIIIQIIKSVEAPDLIL